MGNKVALLFAAGLFIFGNATTGAAQPEAVLRGTVQDPRGTPTPGVVVTVEEPQASFVRVALTDLRGEYRIEGLDGETEYLVRARHPQFRETRLKARAAAHDAPLTVTLKPRRSCLISRR